MLVSSFKQNKPKLMPEEIRAKSTAREVESKS
jgi:hypothetical protein